MKLVIPKSKLGRGAFSNPDESPCCLLGHLSQALGCDSTLTLLSGSGPSAPVWRRLGSRVWTWFKDVERVNDSPDRDYQKLKDLAAEIGVEVEFIDV